MEPWCTLALAFFHAENCLLRITCCFFHLKRHPIPYIQFWVSLKMIPSCHTLSNTFEILSNTLLNLRPSSKELYISWLIDNSWLIQESPGLKPDWQEEISLFSIKNLSISLNINLSRFFPHIGSSDTGR